jgi:coenzyme PQQ biosynthesis protein PqqD
VSEARYRVAPHALLREEGGETVVVLPERAVRLNATGREILSLCDGERGAGEIAAELSRRYAGGEGAGEDVRDFLAAMERLGAVERVGGER